MKSKIEKIWDQYTKDLFGYISVLDLDPSKGYGSALTNLEWIRRDSHLKFTSNEEKLSETQKIDLTRAQLEQLLLKHWRDCNYDFGKNYVLTYTRTDAFGRPLPESHVKMKIKVPSDSSILWLHSIEDSVNPLHKFKFELPMAIGKIEW